jgi:hypothetical protein
MVGQIERQNPMLRITQKVARLGKPGLIASQKHDFGLVARKLDGDGAAYSR